MRYKDCVFTGYHFVTMVPVYSDMKLILFHIPIH